MKLSPAAPAIAAGTVAIATYQAMRSSAVSTRRFATLWPNARRSRTMSRQK